MESISNKQLGGLHFSSTSSRQQRLWELMVRTTVLIFLKNTSCLSIARNQLFASTLLTYYILLYIIYHNIKARPITVNYFQVIYIIHGKKEEGPFGQKPVQ
uniref:Uncharacterized protein n=1 Tax=Micrurus lemniscatus lemniscatus TaxID=129467 RepID=A0A2D4J962_MICLE